MGVAPVEHVTIGSAALTLPPSAAGPKKEFPLGRLGSLEVRLARSPGEVEAAQEVRYRVFRDGRFHGANGHAARDEDRFDAACDHLLVVDTATGEDSGERVVGTYRLLPQERAQSLGSFYSQDEYGIADLVARHPDKRFLELGRSCVLPEYRTRRSVELLWQGIWAYCRKTSVDVMCGCASFEGTVPAAHALAMSYLAHSHAAEGDWQVSAVPGRGLATDMMPHEAVDERAAIGALPPLIKGYLRLGARFATECVVDRDFGTTDVFVVLPIETISPRYIRYYGAEAERFAAR